MKRIRGEGGKAIERNGQNGSRHPHLQHDVNKGVRLEGQKKMEATVGLFGDCGTRSVAFTAVSEIWLILFGVPVPLDLYLLGYA